MHKLTVSDLLRQHHQQKLSGLALQENNLLNQYRQVRLKESELNFTFKFFEDTYPDLHAKLIGIGLDVQDVYFSENDKSITLIFKSRIAIDTSEIYNLENEHFKVTIKDLGVTNGKIMIFPDTPLKLKFTMK